MPTVGFKVVGRAVESEAVGTAVGFEVVGRAMGAEVGPGRGVEVREGVEV